MLHKSFKPGKCKTSLKLATARIKLLKNKRDVQVKHLRRELAQLLESGQEQTARIRVEHVIREEKTMSAYDLIELYCELIVARLPIIESQKSCPIDLKEAIASVVFASPRCADIPELMDIRKHFVAKYGKEFTNSALEVRPDSGVSRLVVEKLSARAPDVETKIKILKAIAQEHNVQWDSEAFEKQIQKPNDDLLNGPNTFANASKMPMESSNFIPSFVPTQTSKSSEIKFQNEASTKPTSFSTSSHTKAETPSTSLPFTSQTESRGSGSTFGSGEVNDSYIGEQRTSVSRPVWNTEFKDATSAAQAAAESAERASMAARAAAEFAKRGNMSRQNSTQSNESFVYGMRDERPDRSKGSNLKDGHIVKQSELKPSEHEIYAKDEILDVSPRKADEKVYGHAQKRVSELEAIEQNRKNMERQNLDFGRENVNASYRKSASSHFASTSDEDRSCVSNINNPQNDEGETYMVHAGEGLFESGPNQPTLFESGHNQPISTDYSSSAIFDDYTSYADDNNAEFGRNKGHSSGSFLPYQAEELHNFSSNVGHSSPEQQRSKFVAQNSSQQHLFTESYPEEHSEPVTEANIPPRFDDSLPATFDSDGFSTDSEDEVQNSTHKEVMRSSSSLQNQRSSTRDSFSEKSSHGFSNTSSREKRDIKETTRNSASTFSSDAFMENNEVDSYSAGKFWKESGSSSLPDNQPSPRYDQASSTPKGSVRMSDYSSTDEEEPHHLHSSNIQPMRKAADKEVEIPSSSFGPKDSEISDEFNHEIGQGLNLGKLRGGLKNRGLPRPPYVRSSVVDTFDASGSTKHISVDTYSDTDRPIVSNLDKPSASIDVLDHERYNQGSSPKSYAYKSRTSGASVDPRTGTSRQTVSRHSAEDTPTVVEPIISPKEATSEILVFPPQESYGQRSHGKGYKELNSNSPGTYFDEGSDEQPRYNIDSKHPRDSASIPLKQSSDFRRSRRTRDVPAEAKPSSFSRFTGHSDVVPDSEVENKPSQTSSPALPPLSNTSRDAINTQRKGNFKSLQINASSEEPPVSHVQTSSTHDEGSKSLQPNSSVLRASNVNIKPSSSTGSSASHESSVKNAPHTHPKLPDYDSLAAHFHSLRSNRQ